MGDRFQTQAAALPLSKPPRSVRFASGARGPVLDAWLSPDATLLARALAAHPDEDLDRQIICSLARRRLSALDSAAESLNLALLAAEATWVQAEAAQWSRDPQAAGEPPSVRVLRFQRLRSHAGREELDRLQQQARAGFNEQLDNLLQELETKYALPPLVPPPAATNAPEDLSAHLTVLLTGRAGFDRQSHALRIRVALESPHLPAAQKQAIHAAARALGIEALSPSFDKDWQVMLAKKKALGPLAAGGSGP
jgi:hypothetical protein